MLTSGGISAVSPNTFAHQTIRYEYAAIHNIEPINVTTKNRLPRGVRVSGSVNQSGTNIGATKTYVIRFLPSFGHIIFNGSDDSSRSLLCAMIFFW